MRIKKNYVVVVAYSVALLFVLLGLQSQTSRNSGVASLQSQSSGNSSMDDSVVSPTPDTLHPKPPQPVRPLTKIESTVVQWVHDETEYPGPSANWPGEYIQVCMIDFDGKQGEEILVHVPRWGGSGGSTTVVLQIDTDGTVRRLGGCTCTRLPLWASRTSDNGNLSIYSGECYAGRDRWVYLWRKWSLGGSSDQPLSTYLDYRSESREVGPLISDSFRLQFGDPISMSKG